MTDNLADIALSTIGKNGELPAAMTLSPEITSICQQFIELYRANGFVPPWIGYLAVLDQQVVGTCAFKSPPRDGRVEIAYYTFLAFEGRGIATEMSRQLIAMAKSNALQPEIYAQTLPVENASTRILSKLGFTRTGAVQHPEDGEVWEWSLRC
jgi:[ribosomal protein S5]-alanine N-acetyltransferase